MKAKVQIDGTWVEADPGETVLGVAKRQGIDIPHLCHDDQLAPFASCFICVVEVEGVANLQPACSAPVKDGMVVSTRNARINASRKTALELLLSNHFADCLGPCKITCPTGVDVQGYLALSAMGKNTEAVRLIKETNPLPSVCGRVCTRPCEFNCRRLFVDESVAIDDVKRFVADEDLFSEQRFFPKKKEARPEKVAIIGSGPAGLTCGYYLAVEGYGVDIFEAQAKPGGMLRYGIPQYRLPEEIIDKEIEGITGLGVAIHTGKRLGQDLTLDGLFEQGYASVFLALGAQKSTHSNVEGENLENVLSGIEFLARVERGESTSFHGVVAVVGGGNTAIDAARTAVRMGAEKVLMLYRRTIKEMPCHPDEVKAAQEEGIEIHFLTNPTAYQGKKGKVSGVVCIRMTLGEPDASGRRRPVPVSGSEFDLAVDYVIEAIGQKPDLTGLPVAHENGEGIRTGRGGTLTVDEKTMETNLPGVFAAGDLVLGPSTVVQAIGGGKRAAAAIHRHVTGEALECLTDQFISRRDNFRPLTPEDYPTVGKSPRHARPEAEVRSRVKTFCEVDLAFPQKDVCGEAERCLGCGCKVFFDCNLQRLATEYHADQRAFDGEFQEHQVDRRHPFIELDMNKCILCAKCIRICSEVVGLNALSLSQRGFATEVVPSLGGSLLETACISCGQCADVCPTGAIVDVFNTPRAGPWRTTQHRAICDYCSVGCEMNAQVVAGNVVRVTRRPESRANPFGNLCHKGRFGVRHTASKDRINQPFLRQGATLTPVSWGEAISHLADQLKNSNGTLLGENAAVMAAPRLTLEELYQIQKFSRVVLQTNHLGTHCQSVADLNDHAGLVASDTTLRQIARADAVLSLRADPMHSHPVVAFELNKLCRRDGQVLTCDQTEDQPSYKGRLVKVEEEKWGCFLQLLMKRTLEQGGDKAAQLIPAELRQELLQASTEELLGELALDSEDWPALQSLLQPPGKKEVMVIWDPARWSGAELPQCMHLLSLLRSLGLKLLTLGASANTLGLYLSGAAPDRLPGGHALAEGRERFTALWQKELPGFAGKKPSALWDTWREKSPGSIWVFGEDPLGTARHPEQISRLFQKAGLKVVFDVLWSKTARAADLILPLPSFLEKDGLLVNCENRLQKVDPILKDEANMSLLSLLAEISAALGYRLMAHSPTEIRAEMVRAGLPINQETLQETISGNVFVSDWFHGNGTTTASEQASPAISVGFDHSGDSLEKWLQDFAHNQGVRL